MIFGLYTTALLVSFSVRISWLDLVSNRRQLDCRHDALKFYPEERAVRQSKSHQTAAASRQSR